MLWNMRHSTLLLTTISLVQMSFGMRDVFGQDAIGECNRTVDLKTGAIILAQPSINAGAQFLDKIVVNSLRECWAACCKLPECNTGVFKSKSPSYCFLFNCTPMTRCSYAPQADYYVLTLTMSSSESASGKRSANLASLLDSSSHQPVGLDDTCYAHHPCTTEHSICSNGICVCQRGWVKREAACVPFVCQSPALQFQCNDSVTCIAIYDRCNGVIECPDGSDESNCPLKSASVEPYSSAKALDAGLHKALGNRSQLSDSSGSHAPSNRLSFLLNPTSREHDLDKTAPSGSHHISDADDLPNLSYIPSSRYGLRSGRFHNGPLLPIDERSGAFRHEGYPNRRSILAPASSDTDWYVADPEWEVNGDDQLSDFDSHYPVPLTTSSHHVPSYGRESRPHYGRDLYHRNDHKLWTNRNYFTPSMLTESDAYDSPSIDADFRPRSYPKVRMREELVDPSVFRDTSSATGWDQSLRRGHALAGKAKPLSKESHLVASSHKAPEHPEQGTGSNTVSTAAPVPNSADHSDDVLSVLQRSQREGHTAAMILAFSLGLVCCFIALLIIEWRRRHRLHGWAVRRRPNNVSVLFGDRRKFSVPGTGSSTRRPQKRTKSFRDPGGYVAVETDPDDEDKLVQEGVVL